MRFVIQVVSSASVTVDGNLTGAINNGFLVLIGLKTGDTREIADKMIAKMMKLRIFPDAAGKTNLSLSDTKGSLLLVSQFTLYANAKKGNRPSFTDAMAPAEAIDLYDHIVDKCRTYDNRDDFVATGIFGADMKVSLVNEGPFTLILDSEDDI